MENQKLDNLLNLAMDATEEERTRSEVLEVGYDPEDREWTLIVKYSGDPAPVRALAAEVRELLNGYAVVRIREALIEELSGLPQVEYIEKPKRLYFQLLNGKRASCVTEVQGGRLLLSGQGVLLAVVDSGIDYTLPDFRNPDGTTRIRYLWDQTADREYTAEQINAALAVRTPAERLALVPAADVSGHGTAVAGIAAGNGRGAGGERAGAYAGVAPESGLLVVKLGTSEPGGFPRTAELMLGVDYVLRKALELGMPVAVNLSFGNSYGPHNGQSLPERYLDSAAGVGRCCICAGAGNEGRGAGHAAGILRAGEEQVTELAVQRRETGLNLQIWKAYSDEAEITLINPAGERFGPIRETLGTSRYTAGGTEILVYYGKPGPYSASQEIFLDLLPRESYITSGIWRVILKGIRVTVGRYDLWLPAEAARNEGTAFLRPDPEVTATIPSTAARIITAGAYDALTDTYADFSGRGADVTGAFSDVVKPDLAAPGVEVTAPAAGGGYRQVTGTSFAVPFVTGSAALLMEWGIVKGNDPYLYGEKLRAYLRRGARKLPGVEAWPNNQTGYGALCVKASIPETVP